MLLSLLLLSWSTIASVSSKDLYKILGVSNIASKSEIKKAYRRKARETHPDKQIGVNTELASMEFREVVEAYEILSDDESRKHYDVTGSSKSKSKSNSNQNNEKYGNGGWNFNFNFNFNGFNFNSGPNMHPLYYDPLRRRQIIDAQSRVVNVRSLRQLLDIISVEVDEDVNSSDFTNFHGKSTVSERYTILAFYDNSIPECVNILQHQVLYPWPFAGFSSEGNVDGSMWWEEVVLAIKINFNEIDMKFKKQLFQLFKFPIESEEEILNFKMSSPYFAIIPRGEGIEYLDYLINLRCSSFQKCPDFTQPPPFQKYETKQFTLSESFREYVWQQLQITVTFVNRSPWIVHFWWLDGLNGKKKEDIQVGAMQVVNTFLSHSFYFRAEHVKGYMLTNEVLPLLLPHYYIF